MHLILRRTSHSPTHMTRASHGGGHCVDTDSIRGSRTVLGQTKLNQTSWLEGSLKYLLGHMWSQSIHIPFMFSVYFQNSDGCLQLLQLKENVKFIFLHPTTCPSHHKV